MDYIALAPFERETYYAEQQSKDIQQQHAMPKFKSKIQLYTIQQRYVDKQLASWELLWGSIMQICITLTSYLYNSPGLYSTCWPIDGGVLEIVLLVDF